MGALSSTSPIQNSAESPTGQNELNDNKITVEQVPKPRKFFKSRNAAPTAEIQQQMVMQQQQATYNQQQSYQNHQLDHNQFQQSGGDDDEQVQKRSRKKKPALKKEKVEKPPKPEKVPRPKKEKKVKAVKEVPAPASEPAESEGDSPSPARRGRSHVEPTRSSGRARAKCVNYNEDAGEDEFYTRIERRIVPRNLVTATITSSPEDPTEVVEKAPTEVLQVPVPQQSPSLHPPIVLRISKVRINICFVIA
jgi:hypothetical protein